MSYLDGDSSTLPSRLSTSIRTAWHQSEQLINTLRSTNPIPATKSTNVKLAIQTETPDSHSALFIKTTLPLNPQSAQSWAHQLQHTPLQAFSNVSGSKTSGFIFTPTKWSLPITTTNTNDVATQQEEVPSMNIDLETLCDDNRRVVQLDIVDFYTPSGIPRSLSDRFPSSLQQGALVIFDSRLREPLLETEGKVVMAMGYTFVDMPLRASFLRYGPGKFVGFKQFVVRVDEEERWYVDMVGVMSPRPPGCLIGFTEGVGEKMENEGRRKGGLIAMEKILLRHHEQVHVHMVQNVVGKL